MVLAPSLHAAAATANPRLTTTARRDRLVIGALLLVIKRPLALLITAAAQIRHLDGHLYARFVTKRAGPDLKGLAAVGLDVSDGRDDWEELVDELRADGRPRSRLGKEACTVRLLDWLTLRVRTCARVRRAGRDGSPLAVATASTASLRSAHSAAPSPDCDEAATNCHDR